MHAVANSAPEPYVDNVVAGKFVGLAARTMNNLARKGEIPAYPYGAGERKTWRFKLSDLDSWMQRRVESQRRPLLQTRRKG